MTCMFVGSNASELTVTFGKRSPNAVHDFPEFVLFHIPPATPAAYIMLGSIGLIKSARVRPPMLPGPKAVHAPNDCVAIEVVCISLIEGNLVRLAVEYWGIRLPRSIASRYRLTGIGLWPSGDRLRR